MASGTQHTTMDGLEDTSTTRSSEPGLDNLRAPGSWATAGHSHAYGSHAPDGSAVSDSSSVVLASSSYRPATGPRSNNSLRKIETLSYYTGLDADGDNQEQPLKKMGLDQLCDLAAKEDYGECNIEQTKSASYIHYLLYSQTGAVDDLERAIHRAKQQIPLDLNRPDYTLRLKNLIVMLVQKYERTSSLDDLQETIFRAQEMIAATPLEHSDRPARIGDCINMMMHKCRRTGSQEDLDEAIITVKEAGAVVSIDKSDHGGRMSVQVKIPM